MSSSTPATAALLQATIRTTAPAIPHATNLGVTHDQQDLYYLLDYLTFAVDRAYPEIPCTRGCSHCCNNQVFRVTDLEWQGVKRAFLALPEPARLEAFKRNHALYAHERHRLVEMAELWSAGEKVSPAKHAAAPKACPLLVDGRCSVYEDRPAICRGYGYFSANIDGDARLLICSQLGPGWVRQLEDAGIEQLPMPNWTPVQRQLDALNQRGATKPLPLWLLELGEELGIDAAMPLDG